MEDWRRVLKDGVLPLLPDGALAALREALAADDLCLVQNHTTLPAPTLANAHLACEGACLVSYPYWRGGRLNTVGQVEQAFADACSHADALVGEPAAVRHLLGWWDDAPREEAVPAVLEEVEREVSLRAACRKAVAA